MNTNSQTETVGSLRSLCDINIRDYKRDCLYIQRHKMITSTVNHKLVQE